MLMKKMIMVMMMFINITVAMLKKMITMMIITAMKMIIMMIDINVIIVVPIDIISSNIFIVLIKVTDDNDHAPYFTESIYIANTIPRKASSKPTQVFDIFASDNDIGSNAALTYSIVHGNTQGKMYIDSKAGIIYCASDLADGDTFDLVVNAKDGGHPSRSTNVTVTIDVVPGNPKSSNPPAFWMNSYTAVIAENAKTGSFVAGLMADDPDNDQLG